MALEIESTYFNAHRDEWIAGGKEGQWAVVYRNELLGFFPSVQAGFDAGVAKWGAVAFLVKRVTPHDTVARVTRLDRLACGRHPA